MMSALEEASAKQQKSLVIDKDHPVLGPFVSKSFDSKQYLQQQLRQVIVATSSGTPSSADNSNLLTKADDEISKLNSGIELLSNEIAQQVTANQHILIQQVVKFNKLEGELTQVRQDVGQLQAGVQRYVHCDYPILFHLYNHGDHYLD